MYQVKTASKFIDDIRAIDDRLKGIKLNKIEVLRSKNEIIYNFINSVAVDEGLKEKVVTLVCESVPPIFTTVVVKIKKTVTDSELVEREIFKFISDKYPSVAILLKSTDIDATEIGEVTKYTISVTSGGAEYLNKSGALLALNEHLSKNFCSEFAGSVQIKPAESGEDIITDEVYKGELEKIQYRTIKVTNIIPIDDAQMTDTAFYIEDIEKGDVTVCGKVTEVREKVTKTNKPFFIFNIDDTTGTLSGMYFSKVATYEKIKRIEKGDAIICRATIGEYNGKPSTTIYKINRCEFPKDFVKKDKYKKSAPKDYSLIFPKEAYTVKEKTVFDYSKSLPKELTEKTYVVFDFETTGIDLLSNGITEIGAVKIIGGVIKEEFQTLVKPDYPISEENFGITGISEDMVADAPKIDEVIGDFVKFIDGAVLVGQNAINFDMKFLKRFAGASDYEIRNQVLDTMDLSREYLPQLRKNDLKTLADHFNVVFHHHRALSDSYATAEVFIELMKIKYS